MARRSVAAPSCSSRVCLATRYSPQLTASPFRLPRLSSSIALSIRRHTALPAMFPVSSSSSARSAAAGAHPRRGSSISSLAAR